MYFFKVPNELYFGVNSISNIKNIKGSKAFIVASNSVNRLGFAGEVENMLLQNGFDEVEIYTEVKPDPTRSDVEKAVEIMIKFRPDWIIAFGGGSAIDTAKAMWVKYEHPELTWDQIILPNPVPKLRNKAKFLSIATTSGTGSEVSFASVVTNEDVTPHVKNVIAGPELCPDVSISDPRFASTMPPSITADTGMDTLTHAIEAYTSVNASEMDKALAIHAIKLTFKSLRKAYANGRDIKARDDMHTASFMAGASFGNAFLGIVHSTAHQLGTEYKISHGRANSIMLPYVIRYNSLAAADRYAEIASEIGLKFDSIEEGVQCLIDEIIKLQRDIRLPLTISECNIEENEFMEKLDALSKNALQDACVPTNARIPSFEDIKSLYEKAYYGTKSE